MKSIEILLIALSLSFCSCQDFLDSQPDYMLPVENAVETVEDCEAFRIGIYSVFMSTSGIAGGGTLMPDLQTDLTIQVLGNKQTFSFVHNWTFTSQTAELTGLWSMYYTVIFRANYLLSKLDGIKAKVSEELERTTIASDKEKLAGDLAKLEDIRSECCMARAYSRVELVKFFADAYDPVQAETQLALAIWDEPVTGTPARTTMRKYYEAVLKDLRIAYKMSNTKADDIYFSKGAVKALETRVHIYMHNWKEAIVSATEVIDNTNYQLLDAAGGQRSAYAKMWKEDQGAEIIWKIGYSSKDEVLGSLGGIFCGLDGTGKFYPDYMPSDKLLSLYQGQDIRDSIFFQQKTTNYSSALVIQAFIKYPGNAALNYTEGVDRYVNMPKVFRLSEIYLLRAEAYYQDKQEGLANADLNALKDKRLADYLPVPLSGDKLYQEIKNERIRELCMEGHRLYDLKRYGEGFARKSQIGGVPASYNISVTPDNVRFTWPIPKQEMDVPNSQVVGNPSNSL